MNFEIIKSIKEISKSYQKFYSECKTATFYHSFEWFCFLEDNYKAIYVIAKRKTEIVGILPLFEEGNSLVSLPYSGEGGPIAENDDQSILRELIIFTLYHTQKYKSIELNSISENIAHLFEKNGFIAYPLYVYPTLKLSTIENFWNDTLSNAKARKSVKRPLDKANQAGLTIKEIEKEKDIENYFALEKLNMRQLESEVAPLIFWKSLFNKISQKSRKFILVVYKGKAIGGRISFFSEKDKTVQNYRGVSLKKYQKYHPNEFMHYYIIQDAINRKYRIINYGASELEKRGSYLFKHKFANNDMILWTAVFSRTAKKKKEIQKISEMKFKQHKSFLEELR